jgi:general secretion pathway protein D
MPRNTAAFRSSTSYWAAALALALAAGTAWAQPAPPPGQKPPPGVRPPRPPVGPPGGLRPGGPGAPVFGPKGLPPAAGKPGAHTGMDTEHEFNECRKVPASKRIKLTLKPDSELADLVGWISSMTCKRFILPSNVRSQKVTIISPEPVTAAEAYRLFLASLSTMGLTVEATGQFLRIIESNRGKESNVPTCSPGEDCPIDDRFVTRMIKLRNTGADEMMAVLNRLKSKDADIIAYGPTNTLIISEWGSNLNRLVDIVNELDVSMAGEKIFTIKLKYAYATEVAAKLQEIFQVAGTTGAPPPGRGYSPPPSRPPGGPAGRTYAAPSVGGEAVGTTGSEISISRIVPDDRTHMLIIVATEKAFERLRVLVHKIDVPPSLGRQRIHVYYLANANADELAGVLNSLVSGSGGARPGMTGSTARPGSTAAPGRPPTPTGTYGATGGYGGMGQPGQFQLFESAISISPDKATNSLVIIATMEDFIQLREVILRLDRPRRQVFIEAAILEVSLDRTLDMGMSFHGGTTVDTSKGQGILFGGSITNQTLNSIVLSPSALSGLAVGLRGPEIPNAENLLGIPGLSLPAFGVMFQAFQTNSDVNVLSLPHILTTDNEKAEITVGQNVPFPGAFMGGYGGGYGGAATGSTGTTGAAYGGLLPTVSVQRQDVALKLSLTPHVNEGDFVRIELDQDIEDIASVDPLYGPTTSKRATKTVVVAKDSQTVVIGGLMASHLQLSETKIPFLGDLPILGYLFKHSVKKTQKTNLLIFLTPYIIKDQADLKRIFERKLRERREFLERYTAFRDNEALVHAEYRTRRGLLEEINRTGREAEEEQRQLDQAEQQLQRQPEDEGPVTDAPPSATRKGGSVVAPAPGTKQPPAIRQLGPAPRVHPQPVIR